MSKKAILRGTARGLTGLVITGVAGLAVFALCVQPVGFPKTTVIAPSAQINTKDGGGRTYGCMGGLAVLGSDTNNSGAAIPMGKPNALYTGGTVKQLESALGDKDAKPTGLISDKPVAGLVTQELDTPDLRGISAVSCAEAQSDQWIIGGDTALGSSGAITVVNPGQQAASIEIRAYTEKGEINTEKPTGILVPAGNSRTVSLNGIVTASNALALRLTSIGSPVYATLSTTKTSDIHPNGIDVQGLAASASKKLTIIGLQGTVDEAEHADQNNPITQLTIFAPDNKAGVTHLFAVTPDGTRKEIKAVQLQAGKVARVPLADWPQEANVLQVESDVPVFASGYARRMVAGKTDYAWIPASETLTTGVTPATVAKDAKLEIFNPGQESARITVSEQNATDKKQELTLAPGKYQDIQAPAESVTIATDQPVQASVVMVKDANIAVYQVHSVVSHDTQLAVYPK